MNLRNLLYWSSVVVFILALLYFYIGTGDDKKAKSFHLEITIKGVEKHKDSFWALGACSPSTGFAYLNFETGKLDRYKYSKLKFNGEKLIIEGNIERPQLYRLTDFTNKLELVFVLGFGDQKVLANIDDLKKKRYKLEPAPFEFIGCEVNCELKKIWNDSLMVALSQQYNLYKEWERKEVLILYGISLDEYSAIPLEKKRLVLSNRLKVSKEKENIFFSKSEEEISKLDKLRIEATINCIKNYPDSYVSLDYLIAYMHVMKYQMLDFEFMEEYIPYVDEKLHGTKEFKQIHSQYKSLERIRNGNPAPNFTGVDIDGSEVNLSDFTGNITLVEFRQSLCDYCEEEQDNLVYLYSKYMNHDFMILSVSFDESKSEWNKYLEENPKPWFQIRDTCGYWKSTIIRDYLNPGIPFYFLVDKDGNIISKGLRCPQSVSNVQQNLNLELENIYGF